MGGDLQVVNVYLSIYREHYGLYELPHSLVIKNHGRHYSVYEYEKIAYDLINNYQKIIEISHKNYQRLEAQNLIYLDNLSNKFEAMDPEKLKIEINNINENTLLWRPNLEILKVLFEKEPGLIANKLRYAFGNQPSILRNLLFINPPDISKDCELMIFLVKNFDFFIDPLLIMHYEKGAVYPTARGDLAILVESNQKYVFDYFLSHSKKSIFLEAYSLRAGEEQEKMFNNLVGSVDFYFTVAQKFGQQSSQFFLRKII